MLALAKFADKNGKHMNPKLSTTFAVVIILLIAGILTWIFLVGNNSIFRQEPESVPITQNQKEQCSKRAYDGEAKIRVWNHESESDETIINIVEEDLEKLPKNCKNQKAKLVDAAPEIAEKIKAASKENPAEITIKGILNNCEEVISLSIGSGEEVFKKYL